MKRWHSNLLLLEKTNSCKWKLCRFCVTLECVASLCLDEPEKFDLSLYAADLRASHTLAECFSSFCLGNLQNPFNSSNTHTHIQTFLLVLLDGFGFSVSGVLKRSQEEHHVSLLVLNWHDVQEAPEQLG